MSLGGAIEAGRASEGRLGGQLHFESPDFLRALAVWVLREQKESAQ